MTVYARIIKCSGGNATHYEKKKLIHSFWVTNESIRLRIVENGRTYVITHLSDLEELFPGNELLSDKV